MRLVVYNSPPVSPDAFLVVVSGNGLEPVGIYEGDMLVVERLQPGSLACWNSLVVRSYAGGLVVEMAGDHNGFHGVVTQIFRRYFRSVENPNRIAAIPTRPTCGC